ncbi:putative metalloprotease CJM1_0395 family protein [Marinobacter caseinilyticus]|uniref:putative metalloprotease CJM1_0395 family protein n=1 Tax=Marinobacter caseinilyticus TaxID=2692195 RepID=UPI00140AC401|nr:putative metalloprotease CJM1_0395 family protein [Marinobacter caseinilyticus]
MNISSSLPNAPLLAVTANQGSERVAQDRPGTWSSNPGEVVEPRKASSSDTRASKREGQSGATTSLDDAELEELRSLKARNREVRAHEMAHQSAGGLYAGAASYTFQRGPDGAQYAVGGEVPIDTAVIAGDPRATVQKMQAVRAAALAPAQPSGQDRAVAAQAMQLMLQAQAELALAGSVGDENAGDRARQGPVGPDDTQSAGFVSSERAAKTYQEVARSGRIQESQRPFSEFPATA